MVYFVNDQGQLFEGNDDEAGALQQQGFRVASLQDIEAHNAKIETPAAAPTPDPADAGTPLPPLDASTPDAAAEPVPGYYVEETTGRLMQGDPEQAPMLQRQGMRQATRGDIDEHNLQQTYGDLGHKIDAFASTAIGAGAELLEAATKRGAFQPQNPLTGETIGRGAIDPTTGHLRPGAALEAQEIAPFVYSREDRLARKANPNSAAAGAVVPDIATALLIPSGGVVGAVGSALLSGAITEAGSNVIEEDEFDLKDMMIASAGALALEGLGAFAIKKAVKAVGKGRSYVDSAVERARKLGGQDALREADPLEQIGKLRKNDEAAYEAAQSAFDDAMTQVDQRLVETPEVMFSPKTLKRTVSGNVDVQGDVFLDLAVQLDNTAQVLDIPEVSAARDLLQDTLGKQGNEMFAAMHSAKRELEALGSESPLVKEAIESLDGALRSERTWGKAARTYADVADDGAEAVGSWNVRDIDARDALEQRLERARTRAAATGDRELAKQVNRAQKALDQADKVTGARLIADTTADDVAELRKKVENFEKRGPKLAKELSRNLQKLEARLGAGKIPRATEDDALDYIAARVHGIGGKADPIKDVLRQAEKHVEELKRSGAKPTQIARAQAEINAVRALADEVNEIPKAARRVRQWEAHPSRLKEKAVDEANAIAEDEIENALMPAFHGGGAAIGGALFGVPGYIGGYLLGRAANKRYARKVAQVLWGKAKKNITQEAIRNPGQAITGALGAAGAVAVGGHRWAPAGFILGRKAGQAAGEAAGAAYRRGKRVVDEYRSGGKAANVRPMSRAGWKSRKARSVGAAAAPTPFEKASRSVYTTVQEAVEDLEAVAASGAKAAKEGVGEAFEVTRQVGRRATDAAGKAVEAAASAARSAGKSASEVAAAAQKAAAGAAEAARGVAGAAASAAKRAGATAADVASAAAKAASKAGEAGAFVAEAARQAAEKAGATAADVARAAADAARRAASAAKAAARATGKVTAEAAQKIEEATADARKRLEEWHKEWVAQRAENRRAVKGIPEKPLPDLSADAARVREGLGYVERSVLEKITAETPGKHSTLDKLNSQLGRYPNFLGYRGRMPKELRRISDTLDGIVKTARREGKVVHGEFYTHAVMPADLILLLEVQSMIQPLGALMGQIPPTLKMKHFWRGSVDLGGVWDEVVELEKKMVAGRNGFHFSGPLPVLVRINSRGAVPLNHFEALLTTPGARLLVKKVRIPPKGANAPIEIHLEDISLTAQRRRKKLDKPFAKLGAENVETAKAASRAVDEIDADGVPRFDAPEEMKAAQKRERVKADRREAREAARKAYFDELGDAGKRAADETDEAAKQEAREQLDDLLKQGPPAEPKAPPKRGGIAERIGREVRSLVGEKKAIDAVANAEKQWLDALEDFDAKLAKEPGAARSADTPEASIEYQTPPAMKRMIDGLPEGHPDRLRVEEYLRNRLAAESKANATADGLNPELFAKLRPAAKVMGLGKHLNAAAATMKVLDQSERGFVHTYLNVGHQVNNSIRNMRAGKALDPDSALFVEKLDQVLQKAADAGSARPGTYYRGVRLSKDELAGLKPGARVENAFYTSTSPSKTLAKGFTTAPWSGGGRKLPVLFTIESKSAIPVSMSEAVHPRGAQFEVVSSKVSGGRVHITLREVGVPAKPTLTEKVLAALKSDKAKALGLALAPAGALAAGAGDENAQGAGAAAASVGLLAFLLPNGGRRLLAANLDNALRALSARERLGLRTVTERASKDNERLLRTFVESGGGGKFAPGKVHSPEDIENALFDVLDEQFNNYQRAWVAQHGSEEIPEHIIDALAHEIRLRNASLVESDPELLRLAQVGRFDVIKGGGPALGLALAGGGALAAGGGDEDAASAGAAAASVGLLAFFLPKGGRKLFGDWLEDTYSALSAREKLQMRTVTARAAKENERLLREFVANKGQVRFEGQKITTAEELLEAQYANYQTVWYGQNPGADGEIAEHVLDAMNAELRFRMASLIEADPELLRLAQVGRFDVVKGAGEAVQGSPELRRLGLPEPGEVKIAEGQNRPVDIVGRYDTSPEGREWAEQLAGARQEFRGRDVPPITPERALENSRARYEYASEQLQDGDLPPEVADLLYARRNKMDEAMTGRALPEGKWFGIVDTHLQRFKDAAEARIGRPLNERELELAEAQFYLSGRVRQNELARIDKALDADDARMAAYKKQLDESVEAEEPFDQESVDAADARAQAAYNELRKKTPLGSVMDEIDDEAADGWRDAIEEVSQEMREEGFGGPIGAGFEPDEIEEVLNRIREKHIVDPKDEIFIRQELGDEPPDPSDVEDWIRESIAPIVGYSDDLDAGIDLTADDVVHMINAGETSRGNDDLTPWEEYHLRKEIEENQGHYQDILDDYAGHYKEERAAEEAYEKQREAESRGLKYEPNEDGDGLRNSDIPDGLPADFALEQIGLKDVKVFDHAGVENVFGRGLSAKELRRVFALDELRTFAKEEGSELQTVLEVDNDKVFFHGHAGGGSFDVQGEFYVPWGHNAENPGTVAQFNVLRVPPGSGFTREGVANRIKTALEALGITRIKGLMLGAGAVGLGFAGSELAEQAQEARDQVHAARQERVFEEQVIADQEHDEKVEDMREKLGFVANQSHTALNTAVRSLTDRMGNERTVPVVPGKTASRGVASFMGSHATLREAYEERREALELLQTNPEALVEELTEGLAELQETAPALHGKLVAQTYKTVQFLQGKLPSTIGASLSRPKGSPPNDLALKQFALYYSAATEPGTVLEDLANNRARREQVDTLKEVWPDAYNDLKGRLVEAMASGKPTTAQRQRLDLLFDWGDSLDTGLSSRLMQVAAQSYQKGPGGGPGGPDEPKGAPGKVPGRRTQPSVATASATGSLSLGAARGAA